MNKTQWLFLSSAVLLLSSLILWGVMSWQTHHPSILPPVTILTQPDLKLLAIPPTPILNEQVLWVATQSAATPATPSTSLSARSSTSPPQLSATSALAIDLASGVPLFSKNIDSPHPPASSIKMMTALIARRIYPLDQVLKVTDQDLTSSNALGLQPGEELTVADLIQSMLVSSSNESAQVLANHSPAGAQDFIQQMNASASALHLQQTTFTSPEGFDDPLQKTSARDLSLLAQELLKDEYLRSIVALPRTTILTTTGQIHELTNTNQFLASPPTLRLIDGRQLKTKFSGIKTGTTPAAGEVLVTAVEIEGHQFLLVVLNSQNRYTDSVKILTWIFNNYQWVNL